MPKCKIEFEGGNTFHAGQLLRGTVRLSLENRRIVRSVYILFRGKATAKWFQESHRNIRNRNHGNGYHRDRGNMFMRGFLPNRNRYVNDIIIRLRSSTEILLDDKQYLEKEFESIGPRGAVHLPPGKYDLPFKFMLPPNLPTSVRGSFGEIRYSARVEIMRFDSTWSSKKQEFIVIRPIDLDSLPAIHVPAEVYKLKDFFSLLSPSNKLRLFVRIPCRGYIPGQTIPLEINVMNWSNQRVHKISIELYKRIHYRAQAQPEYFSSNENTKKDKIKVAKIVTRGCDVNQREVIHVDFDVPSDIRPTDKSISKIIEVSYFLRISCSVGFWHFNPKVDLPIIIGTLLTPDQIQSTVQSSVMESVELREMEGTSADINANP